MPYIKRRNGETVFVEVDRDGYPYESKLVTANVHRTDRAKRMDMERTSRTVYRHPLTPAQMVNWMSNPGRYDIVGFDSPLDTETIANAQKDAGVDDVWDLRTNPPKYIPIRTPTVWFPDGSGGRYTYKVLGPARLTGWDTTGDRSKHMGYHYDIPAVNVDDPNEKVILITSLDGDTLRMAVRGNLAWGARVTDMMTISMEPSKGIRDVSWASTRGRTTRRKVSDRAVTRAGNGSKTRR